MILEILSKISSELLLSLYPVFVKFINLPIGIQMWCRFLTYMVISSFFVNWNFIIKTIFTKYGFIFLESGTYINNIAESKRYDQQFFAIYKNNKNHKK